MICSGHVKKLLAGVKSTEIGRSKRDRPMADTFHDYISIDERDHSNKSPQVLSPQNHGTATT